MTATVAAKDTGSRFLLRPRTLSLLLGLAIACMMLASLRIGYTPLSTATLLKAAVGQSEAAYNTIVQHLRLPRTLLAVLVGAALGGSGALLQGLLRNPLAEAGTLGIGSAAGLGAVIALYFGFASLSPFLLPLFAMAGSLACMGLLLVVSRRANTTLTLVLVGIAISSLCVALTSLAMNLSASPWAVAEIAMWLMGSLRDRTMAEVSLAAPFILPGLALMLLAAPRLDTLSLGEDTARSLGQNIDRTRWLIIASTSLAVGTSVSVSGSISFVGLIVPHMMRPLLGHLPGRAVLPSMLGGALIVLTADTLVRIISVGPELQLGVVTALVGSPLFLRMVFRLHRRPE